MFLLGFSLSCLAHDPGLSSADVILKAHGVNVKITFSLQDIEAFVPMDSDLDAEVTLAELKYGAECSDRIAENMKMVDDFAKIIIIVPI